MAMEWPNKRLLSYARPAAGLAPESRDVGLQEGMMLELRHCSDTGISV
jgi:hypothetical protein